MWHAVWDRRSGGVGRVPRDALLLLRGRMPETLCSAPEALRGPGEGGMSHDHHHAGPQAAAHPMDEGHGTMHGGPKMAQDFLRRFVIVTGLLALLIVFRTPGQHVLRYHDFVSRRWVEFFIATVIFGFGWIFFRHARHE